jgi:indole-3-glycerol phosphate synthase
MILDDIVAAKKVGLEQDRAEVPLPELERRIDGQRAPLDFAGALRTSDVGVIGEIKKASPSKGLLCPDFDPVRLAGAYTAGGAAAISVLTEANYFQGTLNYLTDIRKAQGLEKMPLLRKDFLFDPYQVYESRAFGTDAILLIVAILGDRELEEMIALASRLGMACLVEVHDRAELEMAVSSGANVIGINNRDLRTFEVDIATTERLCPLIPPNRVIVSESGISRREDIDRLRACGVNAVLVGEALVTAGDAAAKLMELVGPRVQPGGDG